ncbi:ion channel [Aestuariibius sp. 2305UL40-4]|uniref:ion channel n=1 Tax=Aestuariibius violaceus TaxID=3234132 RepID=UPI00345EDFD1
MIKAGGILLFGIIVIVIAHTIQIWIWAGSFLLVDAFGDFPTSFYFSTVTYTTLGYGDVVLQPEVRVFATFAAIAGLLTFGISTAFLISLLVRTLPTLSDEAQKH